MEAKNKKFGARADAGSCNSSAQGFSLVRLALGHPALPSTNPQPPLSLSFSIPKDQEIHRAHCKTPNRDHWDIPPLLPLAPADSSPLAGQLFLLPEQAGGRKKKQKQIFGAYGYRWPQAMNCKGQTHVWPRQLPHSSKFC